MNQKPDTTWEFGSIPMIEPEYLGGVLATSSDIAFLIDAETKISVSYTHLTLPTKRIV